eukprot:9472098-Pyramimonas_sp.AAC.1
MADCVKAGIDATRAEAGTHHPSDHSHARAGRIHHPSKTVVAAWRGRARGHETLLRATLP